MRLEVLGIDVARNSRTPNRLISFEFKNAISDGTETPSEWHDQHLHGILRFVKPRARGRLFPSHNSHLASPHADWRLLIYFRTSSA